MEEKLQTVGQGSVPPMPAQHEEIVKIKVHGALEIECPNRQRQIDLVQGMGVAECFRLQDYQKEPKNWPNHMNIPTYCIYMGSGEFEGRKVDFYHYEGEGYSTAIVYGDEPGDYRSGWPELAFRSPEYTEYFKREFVCGFLTIDDLARVGIGALDPDRRLGSPRIRPMRSDIAISIR